MKKHEKKSGRGRFDRKQISKLYHESADKVGKHFSEKFVSRLENVHQVRLWVVEWALLIIVVFLFAIVQNIWYGESYETEAYTTGGDYSEAVLGPINSMNPLYATTSAEKTLGKLLFANIVSPDSLGQSKADLAKSVKMDKSGKVWTLTLRDNIYWSDGQPITADDVIFTIELIRDPTAKTTVASDFDAVEMKKKDDKTVEFKLPSAYIDFIDTLELPLLPEHILGDIPPTLVSESDFSSNPVGSGPFVLKALQVHKGPNASNNKQTVYLNRNERYHRGQTKLNNFTLKVYESRADIVTALNSSDVMATAELGEESSHGLSTNVELSRGLLNGGAFAFMDTTSDVLKNKTLRQAIQKGIDMNKIRTDVDESQYLDYPILRRQADLEFPKTVDFDREEAKKMIEKAGYKYNEEGKLLNKKGMPVTLNAAVQKRDTLTRTAERFVDELKKLGFEVTLNIHDEEHATSDFFSSVVSPREYDILFYEIDLGISADPFVYYNSLQATQGGWNFSNYSNGLVDDALLSAHITTDQGLRRAKYEYFLKAWMSDVPAIGLYQSSLSYYHVANVEAFEENAQLTDALDRFGNVLYWASVRKTVNITP